MKQSELTHGSLFSGIEGFGLGAAFAGIRTLWSCEYEDYQTSIIKKKFGEEHEINRDIKTYSNEINSKRSMQESIFRKPYLSGQYTRVYPGWRTRQSIPSPRFAGKSN